MAVLEYQPSYPPGSIDAEVQRWVFAELTRLGIAANKALGELNGGSAPGVDPWKTPVAGGWFSMNGVGIDPQTVNTFGVVAVTAVTDGYNVQLEQDFGVGGEANQQIIATPIIFGTTTSALGVQGYPLGTNDIRLYMHRNGAVGYMSGFGISFHVYDLSEVP